MAETTTETLYRKQGRRYVPAYSSRDWAYDDLMAVGTYRMVHAYSDGGRRFEYDVTPDTATIAAALMQFRLAVEDAIAKRARATVSGSTVQYTKKQFAILQKFKAEMSAAGGLLPTWWQHASSYDIAQAASDALKLAMEAKHV